MPSLSTPIGELRSEYGVVVIGSGYGGAIAACRMAQHAKATGNGLPAYSVCLLERGLERQAGEYPSAFVDSMKQIQADTGVGRIGRRTGLFDFRMNRDISVLVGCGLGGTSLINAGVMLEPTPAVLDNAAWPAWFRDTGEIESRFDQVRQALGVSLCPPDVELEKMKWLSTAAERLVVKMRPAPVAISFTTELNHFNVPQQRCVLCGNCISGCNHSAKNTVAMNYLPGAANAGASIFCGVETRSIERHGDWWLVHVRLNGRTLRPFGSPEIVIRAKMVFLGAGTLGSTEILLRSSARHKLPVSAQLGRRFTGNGDVIAFGYNAPDRVNGFGYGDVVPRDASVGPTIAAMIDERSDPRPDHRMMIQEGAIPGALRFVLRFGAPVMARATHIVGDVAFDFRFRHIRREIDSMIRGVRHGALARTQTFLAMGHDDGNGRMRLKDDRLRIVWSQAGYQKIYDNIANRLQAITRVMKGRYVINPFWSRLFGRRLMTVHPLGGCCLGEDATRGVVNADGQVFDGVAGRGVHPGLYVCDGSIVPTTLGTNPALTISALAEGIAARATANRVLQAAPAPHALPKRIARSIPGIHYAERLKGHVTMGGRSSRVTLVLHLSAESIEEVINSSEHKLRVIGAAFTPDLLPDEQQWRVSDGTLNVLVDDPRRADTKLLVYRLTLTPKTGRPLWLRGQKVVNLQTLRRDPWRVVTRVPFVLFDAAPKEPETGVAAGVCDRVDQWEHTHDAPGFLRRADIQAERISGVGAVRSSVLDAFRLPLSTTIVQEPRLVRRLQWRWRFNWGFFIRTLLELRIWILRPTRPINPFEGQLRALISRPSTDLVVPDMKERISRYQLTHFRGAEVELDRKPVVLAPGFGMSTDAFRVGNPSIAQHLHDEGYAVWLLDYRGSDKLEVSLTQFTLDELALDFADAIETLYKMYERRRPIRVVAHCVASLTMQMALLNGGLSAKGLHSVVLSQSFAFIDPPWFNKLKSHLHLPEVLAYLNFRPVLTSDYDVRSSFRTRVLDRLLHLYPSNERCGEGVCRRLLLMYGEVIRHDQLDHATHRSMYALFDRANLTSFKHLSDMFARGHLVDKQGRNRYLTKTAGKNVDVPITLIQGSKNGLFRPRGARLTHKWLVKNGGFGPENPRRFTLEVIPGYGHLDNFIGKDAARDVFPVISAALRRM